MAKLPKGKCKKCRHCKIISDNNKVECSYLKSTLFTWNKPRYCSNFEKRNGDKTTEIKAGAYRDFADELHKACDTIVIELPNNELAKEIVDIFKTIISKVKNRMVGEDNV